MENNEQILLDENSKEDAESDSSRKVYFDLERTQYISSNIKFIRTQNYPIYKIQFWTSNIYIHYAVVVFYALLLVALIIILGAGFNITCDRPIRYLFFINIGTTFVCFLSFFTFLLYKHTICFYRRCCKQRLRKQFYLHQEKGNNIKTWRSKLKLPCTILIRVIVCAFFFAIHFVGLMSIVSLVDFGNCFAMNPLLFWANAVYFAYEILCIGVVVLFIIISFRN